MRKMTLLTAVLSIALLFGAMTPRAAAQSGNNGGYTYYPPNSWYSSPYGYNQYPSNGYYNANGSWTYQQPSRAGYYSYTPYNPYDYQVNRYQINRYQINRYQPNRYGDVYYSSPIIVP